MALHFIVVTKPNAGKGLQGARAKRGRNLDKVGLRRHAVTLAERFTANCVAHASRKIDEMVEANASEMANFLRLSRLNLPRPAIRDFKLVATIPAEADI